MCGDSIEMKEMAVRICRDYLHGAWKHVSVQDIGFKRISGGLSNWLYHVWLPTTSGQESASANDSEKTKKQRSLAGQSQRMRNQCGYDDSTEPKQVLLRIYGQVHGDRALEHLITESVIFTLLSERRLGPRLHGVFPGGRIEQYIRARPLKTTELGVHELSVQIAQKMAAIHSMDVPISKEPHWLWNTSERWLSTAEKSVGKETSNKFDEQILKIKSYALRNELAWLKGYLSRINSPVVFSHNDMQEGNILMCQDEDEADKNRLFLIDFEYCSYNYRAFDMANHFLEWTYDYTNPEYPHYFDHPEKYPTKKQQIEFVKTYLKALDLNTDVEEVLNEIKVFCLASHFFWGLWGIANAPISQIPFGYWDYAVSRFDRYFQLKELLTSSEPIGVKRNLHDTD